MKFKVCERQKRLAARRSYISKRLRRRWLNPSARRSKIFNVLPVRDDKDTTEDHTSSHESSDAAVNTDWVIDGYRTPHDTNSLWNLKKWFMQLHKDWIPEDELVTLAQVFASMIAYGCKYEPELMERVTELGKPVAKVYYELKSKRTSCVQSRVQDENHTSQESVEAKTEELLDWRLYPVHPSLTLDDVLRNIVVVNNSLKETTEWFERLGSGTISIAISSISQGIFEVKAYAANFFINKTSGTHRKAYAQCVADLLEILKYYCYQVNYTQRFPYLNYNVERLPNEASHQPVSCIEQHNIGYRLLQKLGWSGGGLGSKQTGILHPIEVCFKHDRRGLGSKKRTKMYGTDMAEDYCPIDVQFYHELMDAILRRQPYYDLIFSPDFTESERILLTRLAVQRRLRCETRISETGQTQFVVKRYPLPPHVVLTQVLVENHPLVSKYYEVKPPRMFQSTLHRCIGFIRYYHWIDH
ncbi:uncharacterized protein LOC126564816 [Anopheles maculipalpis]|uniref:uncharacterized protein LOC126564816 n=1 Tax=Anopheles maculipalpis TaxID=1496333 RepID=UPI0021599908|nr:uncharacterized protein LOC126564816 [Anopheles maculipalpis]